MTSCNQNIGILGGGFGVYGYSQTLLNSGWKVHALERNYSSFSSRLSPEQIENVSFHDDFGQIAKECPFLILALPPKEQNELLKELKSPSSLKHIFLEKPLSTTPKEALNLVDRLAKMNVSFSVGYLMRHTYWFEKLFKLASETDCKIKINWDFRSHHFANNLKNWKATPAEGGGALRFYGIHLIALAQDLGFTEVCSAQTSNISDFQDAIFETQLKRKDGSSYEFNVNSCADRNLFQIIFNDEELVSLPDPFEEAEAPSSQDRRLPYLERYISKYLQKNDNLNCWEQEEKLCQLWANIEESLPE